MVLENFFKGSKRKLLIHKGIFDKRIRIIT
jgi:hypothetical protein